MATENTTTRFSGTLSVGGRVLRGLLTVATGGALVLGGQAVFFDTSQQTTSSTVVPQIQINYGTGAVWTFTQDVFTTGTGGLAGDNVASITVPTFGKSTAGSGALMAASVQCNNAQANITTDLGWVAAMGSSGTNVWNNRQVGTGGLIYWTATGSMANTWGTSRGAPVLDPGNILKVSTTSSVPSGSQCVLRAWWHEVWLP